MSSITRRSKKSDEEVRENAFSKDIDSDDEDEASLLIENSFNFLNDKRPSYHEYATENAKGPSYMPPGSETIDTRTPNIDTVSYLQRMKKLPERRISKETLVSHLSAWKSAQASNDRAPQDQKYLIDELILDLMSYMDLYEDSLKSISRRLSDGYHHYSNAKYKQMSFTASIPTTENIRSEFQENTRLFPVNQKQHSELPEPQGEEGDQSDFRDVEEESKPISEYTLGEYKSPETYLLLFSGLPTTMIKKTQKDFLGVLQEDLLYHLTLKSEINEICSALEQLNHK